MKTVAIPMSYEAMCDECEKVLKKFIEKKLDDAVIIVEKYILTFKTDEGEIRLYAPPNSAGAKNTYIEIKAGSCTVSNSADGNFVLTRSGTVSGTVSAPKLVVGRDTYTVDELVALLRKGFRELLLLAASDL